VSIDISRAAARATRIFAEMGWKVGGAEPSYQNVHDMLSDLVDRVGEEDPEPGDFHFISTNRVHVQTVNYLDENDIDGPRIYIEIGNQFDTEDDD
jgi:hypothetical protein